jgi:regulatory protein
MTSKITSIQVQKNNDNRVNIYIDNEYAFSCDKELVYRHKMKVGAQVDSSAIEEIVENDNYSKAKNDALKFVERSYKTEKEMSDKLMGKGYSEAVAAKVLDFLREYDFIDDKKFAGMFVNDRLKSKGKNRIKYDLLKKGVSEDVISEKLNSVDPEKERDTAYELGSKKYASLIKREADKRKISQKLYQYLTGRGYSWEVCKTVINRILEEEIIEE